MAWWEYPTNYSVGKTINGTWDLLFGYPQYILSGWHANGIILLMWVIIFGVSLAAGSRKALLTSSAITSIFAIMLSAQGSLNPVVPIALIILSIIGAIGTKEEGGY